MRKGSGVILMAAVALAVLAALGLGVQADPGPDQSADPGAGPMELTYVGADTCVGCHEDKATGLAGTPHGKREFATLSSLGCETCHGPGSLHVEDPTVVENQPRIDTKTAAQQNAVCQQCHDGGKQFFWKGSMHETRGLACTTCHGVHTYASEDHQLKQALVMDQCFECHKDIRAETWKRSHHPIREGRISCVDCHNPHGAQSDKMVNAASINEQCWTCHTEKRGPFLWEHAPARENCVNCHTPHGSNHLKLQKTSVPYLCQQCHSNTRHPGTLYDRTRLADGTNPSNREFSRACLNCHSQMHGSNHPSGWVFQR